MKYDETIAAMQLGFNSVPKDCDLLILYWEYQTQLQQLLFRVLYLMDLLKVGQD